MFERRHYQHVAKAVRESDQALWTTTEIAKWLASVFAADNPNFDWRRFLDACELNPNESDDNCCETEHSAQQHEERMCDCGAALDHGFEPDSLLASYGPGEEIPNSL